MVYLRSLYIKIVTTFTCTFLLRHAHSLSYLRKNFKNTYFGGRMDNRTSLFYIIPPSSGNSSVPRHCSCSKNGGNVTCTYKTHLKKLQVSPNVIFFSNFYIIYIFFSIQGTLNLLISWLDLAVNSHRLFRSVTGTPCPLSCYRVMETLKEWWDEGGWCH